MKGKGQKNGKERKITEKGKEKDGKRKKIIS